jgi:hypothetical protein
MSARPLRRPAQRPALCASGTGAALRRWKAIYPVIFRGVDLIAFLTQRAGERKRPCGTHLLLSLQGTESARLWRSRVSAGRAQARDAFGAMPGLRRVHEPPHLLSQAEGGGRRSEGFNAVRGLAPKPDARTLFQSSL